MSRRSGGVRPGVSVATPPLRLLPPRFVEAPPGQQQQLLTALRELFRAELEERLASSGESSIHPSSMPGETAQ